MNSLVASWPGADSDPVLKVVSASELEAATIDGWQLVGLGVRSYEMTCWKDTPCRGPLTTLTPCQHSVYEPSYCGADVRVDYSAPATESTYIVGMARDEWKTRDAKKRLGEKP